MKVIVGCNWLYPGSSLVTQEADVIKEAVAFYEPEHLWLSQQ